MLGRGDLEGMVGLCAFVSGVRERRGRGGGGGGSDCGTNLQANLDTSGHSRSPVTHIC